MCQKVLKRTGATREKNNLKEKLKRYTTTIHVAHVTRIHFGPKNHNEYFITTKTEFEKMNYYLRDENVIFNVSLLKDQIDDLSSSRFPQSHY